MTNREIQADTSRQTHSHAHNRRTPTNNNANNSSPGFYLQEKLLLYLCNYKNKLTYWFLHLCPNSTSTGITQKTHRNRKSWKVTGIYGKSWEWELTGKKRLHVVCLVAQGDSYFFKNYTKENVR